MQDRTLWKNKSSELFGHWEWDSWGSWVVENTGKKSWILNIYIKEDENSWLCNESNMIMSYHRRQLRGQRLYLDMCHLLCPTLWLYNPMNLENNKPFDYINFSKSVAQAATGCHYRVTLASPPFLMLVLCNTICKLYCCIFLSYLFTNSSFSLDLNSIFCIISCMFCVKLKFPNADPLFWPLHRLSGEGLLSV